MPRSVGSRLRAADIELPSSPAVEDGDDNEGEEGNSKDGRLSSFQMDGISRPIPKGEIFIVPSFSLFLTYSYYRYSS